MIYKFVTGVIVLNLIYELVEIIFPSSKMKSSVKSFVLILLLYVVIDGLSKII